jgi:hypothetical protein
MSDCRRWRATAGRAVLLLALGATGALAQSQAEYRARLQRLVPLWHRLTAEARRVDSVAARRLPTDTIVVGPLRVIADTGMAELAHGAAERTDAALTRRFGPDLDALRPHLYVLQAVPTSRGQHALVAFAEVDATGRPVEVGDMPRDPSTIAETWAMRGAGVLTGNLGPAFGEWLDNALPIDSSSTNTWVGVRIDLVTSPFRASRQCYVGDIRECERALGVADDNVPFRDWFTTAERQEILYRDRYALRGIQPGELGRCLNKNDDSACLALGQLIPPQELAPPLGPASRQSLAALAMTMGGPQSYRRMLGAPRVVRAQLEAAAEISVDSLVRRWRAAVLTTEAEHTTMTPGLALISLLWAGTCGALALGSSRWR